MLDYGRPTSPRYLGMQPPSISSPRPRIPDPVEERGLPQPRVKYDQDKFQVILECRQFKPDDLDVRVEGDEIIISAKDKSKVFEQKFTLPTGSEPEQVKSTYSKGGILTVTVPRQTQHSDSELPPILEEKFDKNLSPRNWNSDSDYLPPPPPPLPPRNEIVPPRNEIIPPPKSEANLSRNDAISQVEYDEDNYKILVDVIGFEPDELIIKTLGNSVQLEAKHEEVAAGRRFVAKEINQSFTLPKGIEPESVTSSLSRDGILTISAPLPPELKVKQNERLVPIKLR